MKYAIVSSEIVCAIVMLIVVYAIIIEKKKTLSQKYFLNCIFAIFAILLCDAFSYILEGRLEIKNELIVINFLTLILADVLVFFVACYVWSVVDEKKHTTKVLIYLVAVLCLFDFVFEIYGCVSHKTFEIVNGVFVAGPLYDVGFSIQLTIMLMCVIHLIINTNVIGIKTLVIFGIYFILPALSILVIFINPDWSFACSAIALSFLLAYIGIEKESKDKLMSTMLRTDILTGLLNRNAFEEATENYLSKLVDEDIGVVFCDVNSLKTVNDNYGHSAGDQLIIKFANILKDIFKGHMAYRISGDEFVIITDGLNKTEFNELFNELKLIIKSKKDIASCGETFGNSKNIFELIALAETKMYEDKSIYYKEHGENRRRTN